MLALCLFGISTAAHAAPSVSSVVRAAASPTNAAAVDFTVTFSEAVTGVDVTDFQLATGGGIAGASVTNVLGGGTTYTVTAGTGTGDGTLRLDVLDNDTILNGILEPLGGVGVGNGAYSSGQSYTIDKTPPVAILQPAGGQPNPTDSLPITFAVSVSGATSGTVDLADIVRSGTATGGSVSKFGNLVFVNGLTGEGTVVLQVAANTVFDDAGNGNLLSSNPDNVVTYDLSGPNTVSIVRAGSSPTASTALDFTVTFDEGVTGVDAGDFSPVLVSGTLTGLSVSGVSGAGDTYTVTVNVSATGEGVLRLDLIDNGSIEDVFSRPLESGDFTTGETYTIERTPPVVDSITRLDASPTSAATVRFAVAFSEAVTGVDTSDFSLTVTGVTGASVTNVSGSSDLYTVTVNSGTGNGTIRLDVVDDGTIADTAGNLLGGPAAGDGAYSSGPAYSIDKSSPTVTINQAATQSDPTSALPIRFTVLFSESVVGFSASDVVLSGTATGVTLSVLGTGNSYTLWVNGVTGDGTVVPSVPAGAATDAAGNPNQASTSTDNSVLYDSNPPSVTINQAAGQSDPVSALPIVFDVLFSEAVTGFEASDVVFTSGTGVVFNVSGAGTSYQVNVTAADDGVLAAAIPAGAAVDAVGNASLDSTSTDNSVTLNRNPPAITIGAPTPAVTASGPVDFAISYQFADTVTLAPSDISITATGTASVGIINVSGSGSASRTVTLDGFTGNGTVAISIASDTATGPGGISAPGAGPSSSVTVDNAAPVLTLSTTAADPTNASPITVEAVFSEAVTGFDASDVTPLNASVSGFTQNAPDSYTFSLTPLSESTFGVTVGAGAATDAAGNGSTASSISRDYDATPPNVQVDVQAADPAIPFNTLPIVFDVAFSEAVTGFDAGDVVISGTAAGVTYVLAGAGDAYTVTITGVAVDGTIAVSVPAGVAEDAASNVNTASSGGDDTAIYDTTAPAVIVNQAAGQPDPTASLPIVFDVTFSEPVTGFDAADIDFGGATGIVFGLAGSGDAYTITITAADDGIIAPTIPAGAAVDAAGNSSEASAGGDNAVTLNTQPPTVTVSAPSPAITASGPVAYTVTYGGADAVTLDVSDVSLVATGTAAASVSVSGTGLITRTVTLSSVSGDGTLTIEIAAGTAATVASVQAPAVTSVTPVVVDNTPPEGRIEQAPTQGDPTNTQPMAFQVLFNEPVTGFDSADVILGGTAVGGTVSVSGTGASYDVEVADVSLDGTVIPQLVAGGATDAAGNAFVVLASADNEVTYSTVPAGVAISAPSTSLTTSGPVSYTVSYINAAIISISEPDIALVRTGTADATVSVSGSGTAQRTITLSGVTGDGTLAFMLAPGTAETAAGTPSPAAGPSPSVTVDNTAPEVTVNQASTQNDPTDSVPLLFEVSFSEPVAGFTSADLVFGGTATGPVYTLTGSGADYVVTVTDVATDGVLSLTVPAAAALDAAGNPSLASTSTDNAILLNRVPPTISVSPPNPLQTSAGPVSYTVTYSGATGVTLALGDISLTSTGTANAGTVDVSGTGLTTRTVTLSGITGEGTIGIAIAAGTAVSSGGRPADAAPTVTPAIVDTTAPTVTVEQGPFQRDPTGRLPLEFVVEFSEPVTGFSEAGVLLTGTATGVTFVVTGTGREYRITVTGVDTDGTLTASVLDGAAQDLAGNPCAASASVDNTITLDRAAPTLLAMRTLDSNPTNAAAVRYEVVFDKLVSNVDAGDFAIIADGLPDAMPVDVTGSGTTYSVGVSTGAGEGTLRLALSPVVSITDEAGNALPFRSFPGADTYVIDRMPPVVVAMTRLDPSPTTERHVRYAVDFSEPVAGVDAGDFDVEFSGIPTASIDAVNGAGASYIVTIEAGPRAGEARLVLVDDDSIVDLAGNPLGGTGEHNGDVAAGESYLFESAGITYYVDQTHTGPEDGSIANPFTTIARGLAATTPGRGDRVVVAPGTYEETVFVPDAVELLGEESAFRGVIASDSGPAVTLADFSILRRFTVACAGGIAVLAPDGVSVEITNCVLHGSLVGLRVDAGAETRLVNNTVVSNETGLDVAAGGLVASLQNNIFSQNGVAISASQEAILEAGYNNFVANTHDWLKALTAPTDFSDAPAFVNPGNRNYHLAAESTSRNAGNPDSIFNDIDGTRNDLGADGGPDGVQDLRAPAAVILTIPSPPVGVVPLNVGFDGGMSSDEWGIQRYVWDLDASDGLQEHAEGAQIDGLFPAAGRFVVTLTVTDNNGLTAEATVDVVAGNAPLLTASAIPQAGQAPLEVAFTAETDVPATIAWDFENDGVTDSTEPSPVYTYAATMPPGMYDARVTAVEGQTQAESTVLIPLTLTRWPVLLWRQVDPGVGGTLSVDGVASVEIPGDAVSRPVVFALTDAPTETEIEDCARLVSLEPEGFVLSAPASVVLSGFEGPACGYQVRYWDHDSASWRNLPDASLFVRDGQVGFEATLMTRYAVCKGFGENNLALAALLLAMASQLNADGGGSDPCFIATAVCGASMERELETLRAFRDDVLLTGPIGIAATDAYYRVSPPAARWLSGEGMCASTARRLLIPLVMAVAWAASHPAMCTACIALVAVQLMRKRVKVRWDR